MCIRDSPGPDNAAGFGRIDVVKALEHLATTSAAPTTAEAAA